MSGASQLFNVIDRFTAQRGPYARRPVEVMIVTAIGTNVVYLRHAYESSGNGYAYPYLKSYAPTLNDRVAVEQYPSGPVVTGALSS